MSDYRCKLCEYVSTTLEDGVCASCSAAVLAAKLKEVEEERETYKKRFAKLRELETWKDLSCVVLTQTGIAKVKHMMKQTERGVSD